MLSFASTFVGTGFRCMRALGAGLVALVAISFLILPFAAQAQTFHGTQVQKSCPIQVRNCLDDTHCDDGAAGLCTPGICDTTLPRTTSCTIRATNADEFGDSVTITGAFDEITVAGPSIVRIPAGTADLAVSATSGAGVTCTAGELPCTLSNFGDWVQFESTYTLTPADNALTSLPDQATIVNNDNCDDPDTTGCSSAPNNTQQTAASDVVDACSTGEIPNCDDNNACTADSCDPATGLCVNVPDVNCDDDNACTADSCDPATGNCINTPDVDCDDDNACTADSCDPATGNCINTPDVNCDDNNACTADSCDPATGNCINTPDVNCDDNNACTADSCDPATGNCINTPDVNCDDDNACTADSCDPATGNCINTPDVNCDDSDVCTADSCDPATGFCVNTPDLNCDDGDACTADSCDPILGCLNTPIDSPECTAEEICRTPGFWATHGGDDKNGSQNITQMVIDGSASGYLSVCGHQIDTTDPNSVWSTSNAMCTAVKGVKERQLVRQLTALALNCVMSGGDGDCSGTSVQGLADECNAICDGNAGSGRSINDCISEIDCFNNGGAWDGNSCLGYVGMCSSSGADCDSNTSCPEQGEVCNREPDCHSVALCQDDGELCFTPPGPAGGINDCKAAKKNGDYLPY